MAQPHYPNHHPEMQIVRNEQDIEFVSALETLKPDDGVQVTLRGEGIRIPDTRPEVVVTAPETATSEPVEFVMDSAASAGGTG